MRDCGGSLFSRSLVFNLRFAGKHHWNVIAYRINAMALRALESIAVVNDYESCLAERANQDLEQLGVNGHAMNGSTGERL